MIKSWHDEAWDEYLYWQTQDRKTLVFRIVKDILEIAQCGSHYGDK